MQEAESVGSFNDRLAARAAAWYARLRAPDCSSMDRREFDAWLYADERHRLAFEATSRAASSVSEALRLDPRLRAMLEEMEPVAAAAPAAGQVPRSRRDWRRMRFAAAAAAVVGVALSSSTPSFGPSVAAAPVTRYENGLMQESTVTLADGSVVHLDAGAVVTAQLVRDARRLTLLQGRAYFEVAHDASRPFSVEAGGTRTVALGTRFEVRLDAMGTVVTLAEGSVAVTPTRPAEEWKHTLSPGQQLAVDASHPQGRMADVDASEVTAWSRGRLVFDGEPLSAVLEEVNRYSAIKVVLGDERLAPTPIGGTFAAGGDAGAFVQALSAILPVRSEPSGDHEIVLFRRERSATPN